jgi:hypothetical protein
MIPYLLFASASSHRHISSAYLIINATVEPNQWFFENRSVKTGDAIMLDYPDPFGVLSLIAQPDFSIRIWLHSPMESSANYVQVRPNPPGFQFFGSAPAIVQIVALADTQLTLVGAYLGTANRTCNIVHPAGSTTFSVIDKPRTCFLVTDTSVSAQVAGSLGVSHLEIASTDNSTEYLSPPDTILTHFQLMFLTSGLSTDDNFSIAFSGGRTEMDFDSITPQSLPGVIGRGFFASYDSMTDRPTASTAPDDNPSLLVAAGMAAATLSFGFFITAVLCSCTHSCPSNEEEKPKLVLYEPQDSRDSDGNDSLDKSDAGSVSSGPREKPPSPYENTDPPYL